MNRRALFRILGILPAIPIMAHENERPKISEVQRPISQKVFIQNNLKTLQMDLLQIVERSTCFERETMHEAAKLRLIAACVERLIYDHKVITDNTLYYNDNDYSMPRMVVYLKKNRSVTFTMWTFGPPSFVATYGKFWTF